MRGIVLVVGELDRTFLGLDGSSELVDKALAHDRVSSTSVQQCSVFLTVEQDRDERGRPIDRLHVRGAWVVVLVGRDHGRAPDAGLVLDSWSLHAALVGVMTFLTAVVAGDPAGRRGRVSAWRARGTCGLTDRRSWTRALVACTQRTALFGGVATQAMQLAELAAAGDRLDLRSLASHGCLSLRWLPRERLGDADELFNRGLGFLELTDRRVDVVAERVRERAQEVRCRSLAPSPVCRPSACGPRTVESTRR